MDQVSLHPYAFIRYLSTRKNQRVFETRINFQKTVCMIGRDCAQIFYDKRYFTRTGAYPSNFRKALFSEEELQKLDGKSHFVRRHLYLSLYDPERLNELVTLSRNRLRQRTRAWELESPISLFDEISRILCQSVCTWSGISIDNLERRTRANLAMITESAGSPICFLKRLLARRSLEDWVGRQIEEVRRNDQTKGPQTALEIIAFHREANGDCLPSRVAAAELIDIIRPTIAVAYVTACCALALQEFPQCRPKRVEERVRFLLEVKRYYPFLPVIAARVKRDFMWRGFSFKKGRRVLFDLYGTNHDPQSWTRPEIFHPERFSSSTFESGSIVALEGSRAAASARYTSESIADDLVLMTLNVLLDEISYDVPPQNLSVSRNRFPARPKGGFVVTNVKVLN